MCKQEEMYSPDLALCQKQTIQEIEIYLLITHREKFSMTGR